MKRQIILNLYDKSEKRTNMKISTKGRYALRILLELAQSKDEGYISLGDIAKRQDISKKYLEQIVPLLVRAEILKAGRGYQGGYMLAKSADEITVWEVLRITEGSLAPVQCLEYGGDGCERRDECLSLDVWKGLGETIERYLKGITLQGILDNRKK